MVIDFKLEIVDECPYHWKQFTCRYITYSKVTERVSFIYTKKHKSKQVNLLIHFFFSYLEKK